MTNGKIAVSGKVEMGYQFRAKRDLKAGQFVTMADVEIVPAVPDFTIMPDNPPNAIPAECQQFGQVSIKEVAVPPCEMSVQESIEYAMEYARKTVNSPCDCDECRKAKPKTEHDKMTDFFFDSKGE